MNSDHEQELRELARKHSLTGAERARVEQLLGVQPEARAEWELEHALTEALQHLPAPPVSSNFTARVLRAAELEARPPAPAPSFWAAWLRPARWLPYAATGALVMTTMGFVWLERRAALDAAHALAAAEIQLDRVRLARDAATLHSLAPVPSIELLQDFDAIRRLSLMPVEVDQELLATAILSQ